MSTAATPRIVRLEPDERPALSAWIQLAAVLLFAALAAPFFLGRVYVADDLGEFHLPLRNFYAEQLGRGEPFDWMPSLYGGFYVAAEGQLGAYHPLHLLLYRWLPLGAAFDIELLASYPLMFVGMYWFLKRMVRRSAAAWFGALTFTFCGFNLLHFVHPNAIAIVAHIPWLLLAIDAALRAPARRQRATAELAIGLLTASQLLLGYPQYVWFSLLIEAGFAIWRATGTRFEARRMALLVVAKMLGALAAAIQLLPTLSALSESVRRAPDAALANDGSLHPLNLVQLVAPYLFQSRVVGQNTHELGLYAGAVPLLLCLWLLAERRRWGRLGPPIRALLALGAVALLLAMGQYGGLYRLQSLIPLVDRFRFPCRAIVLVQFCVASGAAIALALLLGPQCQRFQQGEDSGRRALASALVGSIGVAIAGPLVWPQYVAGAAQIWCGPILIGIAAGLIVLVERRVRGAAVALVALTALDLGVYGLSYSVYPATADLHEFAAGVSLPPRHANSRVAAFASATGLRTGDRMLLAGLQRVDGYAGLEPAKRLNYNTIPALRLAGASWIFQPAAVTSHTAGHWAAVVPTAPRARLVTGAVVAQRFDETETFDLDRVAVDEDLGLRPSNPGSAEVIADLPGHIAIATDAPTRQLLVTTESFDSGWRADVDGKGRPVVRVNGDFLGCVVDEGAHRVRFAFRPPSLELGAIISVYGLELMMCVFLFRFCGCARRGQ